MPPAAIRQDEGGFSLVEIVVATALVGVLATILLGGLLFALKEARRGKVRAAAAAWVQAELDYLRIQGYSVPAASRTLTPTSGYTAYGDLEEPRLPEEFDRAEIVTEDLVSPPVRRLTVRLYETASSPPYTILSTYVSNFTYATP
ncbi:MAG: type II secretion system protein [Armatimonadota bacterium]|nr:type II secretion system protein [Armatimonadota bacterium]MDR7450032.1 type II secretion system protein [Armatimonadota bacterium]MDR7480152.1 type II secretion system protein [Armatimonadota bacterium]MDR7489740.1 type II secretion system protein [Armatimonadota bacterium]MDR7490333.1 type II secretion system protein [Armatimonadota bacterium]